MANRRSRVLKTLLGFTLLLAFLAGIRLDLSSYLTPERIQGQLAAAGVFAPLLLMLLMATTVVVAVIPGLPLDIAAGIFFGPLLGTLYSALGALAGAILSFFIARLLGRKIIERLVRGHINFCVACSDRLLTKLVFFSRLLPVVSFDVVSYGAGLTKMSLAKFSLATFLGMLPWTFIYNYFGSAVIRSRTLTAALAVVLVALFFVIPVWIERYDLFSLRKFFHHPDGDPAG